MENPEEILHSLEEFSKMKPKDIPRELEEYLCYVAKTGDPVYQWSSIKSLLREKLVSVITEFYETCPSVEIPPCPNVDLFNYDGMKSFILEKLDTFAAAPFTVQRICELLTTPRKEYNRIDKYMRALEKNILVVSTVEPGGRRSTENGEGIMNGLESSEHLPENNSNSDINVDVEMDETPAWPRAVQNETVTTFAAETTEAVQSAAPEPADDTKISDAACSSSQDTVITCRTSDEPYVSIEPVPSKTCTTKQDNVEESDISITITAIPAGVQKRRNSLEPVVSSDSVDLIESTAIPIDTDKSSEEGQPEETICLKKVIADSSQNSDDIANKPDDGTDETSSVEDQITGSPDHHGDAVPEEIKDDKNDDNNSPNCDGITCSDSKVDDIVAGPNELTVDEEITSSDISEPHSSSEDGSICESKIDSNEASSVEIEKLDDIESRVDDDEDDDDENNEDDVEKKTNSNGNLNIVDGVKGDEVEKVEPAADSSDLPL